MSERNGPREKEDPRRILVIRLSALGDVVRTVPAVVSIAAAYPQAEITWVTETLGASFLTEHPSVHGVLVMPTRVWRKILLRPTGIVSVFRQVVSFVRQLRSGEYDAVVDFHGVFKSAVVCRLARAPRRIGYDRSGAKEMSYLVCTEKVSLPPGKLSRYERNMKLAEHLGGEAPALSRILPVPDHMANQFSSFFEDLPAGRPVFAIHPGTSARAPYKRWFADRYAKVADEMVRRFNGTVVITWAPDEHGFASEIADRAQEEVLLAPHTPTPLHLAAVFSRSDMYVGSDTGAMHIATLTGTPVVALWGPTDPVENEPGPYSPHETAAGHAECAPCRKMGCTDRRCMAALEVDDVLAAVERLIRRAGIAAGRDSGT